MAQPQQPFDLQIDIVSDVVCPWCVIGYLQLRRGLANIDLPIEPRLRWRPFELNPDMPAEGQDLREHIAQKYGPGSGGGMRGRLVELGESLGFRFDYHEGMRMVNTFHAHQLLHWAGEQDGEEDQTALKLALFEAFFSRREDVSDREQLLTITARAGLDTDVAAGILERQTYAETVRAEQRQWREREVHSVPMFFFQGQYMVPGAQDATTFERVLRRIYERAAA